MSIRKSSHVLRAELYSATQITGLIGRMIDVASKPETRIELTAILLEAIAGLNRIQCELTATLEQEGATTSTTSSDETAKEPEGFVYSLSCSRNI